MTEQNQTPGISAGDNTDDTEGHGGFRHRDDDDDDEPRVRACGTPDLSAQGRTGISSAFRAPALLRSSGAATSGGWPD